MYKFLIEHLLIFLGIHLGMEFWGHMVGNSAFNFLHCCQTVFHSDCAILHANQRCMRVEVFPHLQHFPFSNNGYPSWCEVVSHYDFELLFHCMGFWPFSYFSGEMAVKVLCPFLNWVVFLLLSCKDS